MRFTTLTAFLALAVALLAFAPKPAAAGVSTRFGLAWAWDDRVFHRLSKGRISWYWHWQEGPVKGAGIEYVPNFWGERYWSKWGQRKAEMRRNKPKALLAFNEPDVKSQSNMSPQRAAQLWVQELKPWQKKGVKVSSPQIVWDINWMDKFMKEVRKRGGEPDFMAIHYYGSWKSLGRMQTFVKKIRKRYGKLVWVTEYGVTASSHGSQAQINKFNRDASNWLAGTGYVARAAWLGCFAINKPPDSFAAARNAMLNSNGSLRSLAHQFMFGGHRRRDTVTAEPAKRSPGTMRSHAKLAKRIQAREEAAASANGSAEIVDASAEVDAEADVDNDEFNDDEDIEDDDSEEAEDCDEFCQLREQSIASHGDDDDVIKGDGEEHLAVRAEEEELLALWA